MRWGRRDWFQETCISPFAGAGSLVLERGSELGYLASAFFNNGQWWGVTFDSFFLNLVLCYWQSLHFLRLVFCFTSTCSGPQNFLLGLLLEFSIESCPRCRMASECPSFLFSVSFLRSQRPPTSSTPFLCFGTLEKGLYSSFASHATPHPLTQNGEVHSHQHPAFSTL